MIIHKIIEILFSTKNITFFHEFLLLFYLSITKKTSKFLNNFINPHLI
jgi:hypothetical protein